LKYKQNETIAEKVDLKIVCIAYFYLLDYTRMLKFYANLCQIIKSVKKVFIKTLKIVVLQYPDS